MTSFTVTRQQIEAANYRQLQKLASQASKAYDTPYPKKRTKDSLTRFLAQFAMVSSSVSSQVSETADTTQYESPIEIAPATELACLLGCPLTCELPEACAPIVKVATGIAVPQAKITSIVLFAASFVMTMLKSVSTGISFEPSPFIELISKRYGYAAFFVIGLALLFAFVSWVWRHRSEVLAPVSMAMALWMIFVH